MDVSVAICTWKRSQSLEHTLESLTRVYVPDSVSWEVIVVNNCQCDSTDEVLKRFATRLPLRTFNEPRLGLSHARNRAIAEAQGEFILWTDDDVLVDSAWLADYMQAIRSYPTADFFGGPIDIRFVAPPPFWIQRSLGVIGGAFARLDLGSGTRWFAVDEEPFGANMAIRRSALLEVAFDPTLGPVGNSQVRGDESDVFRRLQRKTRGVWVGSAKVVHCIGRERTTLSYLWDYYVGYGRTLVRSGRYRKEFVVREPIRWLSNSRALYLVPLPSHYWVRAMRRAAIWTGISSELASENQAGDKEASPAATQHKRRAPLGGFESPAN